MQLKKVSVLSPREIAVVVNAVPARENENHRAGKVFQQFFAQSNVQIHALFVGIEQENESVSFNMVFQSLGEFFN